MALRAQAVAKRIKRFFKNVLTRAARVATLSLYSNNTRGCYDDMDA